MSPVPCPGSSTFWCFFQSENSKQQVGLIQQQITEVGKKVESLEERLVFGEVPKKLYEKFSPKLKLEIKEAESQLTDLRRPKSNHQKFLEMALKFGVTICKSWEEANYFEKQNLQTLLFPEGVLFDREKQSYRTTRVNSIFKVSSSFNALYKESKNKKTSPKTGF